ncbi:MAG: B12-binding domain-containing radical SAM protein [Elusimicrobia bacterium]|nr:B12-binding domain-containing radical SAM protein [Elusimicrobiota bacterium]
MKILLIQPPLNRNLIGSGVMYLSEPLALEVVAASVPEHAVRIIDMRLDPGLQKCLNEFQPDVVGITALTPDVYLACGILKEVKDFRSDIFTVVGGHHATMVPQDFNRGFVDAIVTGEGQQAFVGIVGVLASGRGREGIKLVRGLLIPENGKLHATPEREMPSNLDDFPLPARRLTQEYRQNYFRASWRPVASLMTSRGCPFRCNFCAVWKHEKGRYRVRSAEKILEEIESLQEPYVSICDDNFLQDIVRADRLYRLIKENGIRKKFKIIARSDVVVKHPGIMEKYREIGTELVLLGIESFRDEELKSFNKRNTVENNDLAINILHKNGITVIAQFIIKPEYTERDFQELGDYVERMGLKHPIFSVLTPLPGTDLYHQRFNDLLTHNYEYYDFIHCVLPTKIERKKFYKCLADLYMRCYTYEDSKGETGSPHPERIVNDKIIRELYSSILDAYNIS